MEKYTILWYDNLDWEFSHFIIVLGCDEPVETFYLIDFENVHNNGIENIASLTKEDHIHIFSTKNALDIRTDIFWLNRDIQSHLVPVRKQSLDMHLVSYLGHLLGIHGNQCSYVIISKDTDYDNIIDFWKEEGYNNISRKQEIPGTAAQNKDNIQTVPNTVNQNVNSKIRAIFSHKLSGNERSKLNSFVQHGLMEMGYTGNDAGTICKYVIAHCNDEQMLNGIYYDIRTHYNNHTEIYQDVKTILVTFSFSQNKEPQRDAQVRSFFNQNFKKKIYVDCKEEIIEILLNSKSRQQVNNSLMKLYSDSNVVKHIYQTVKPLIKDLPGK